MGDGTFGPCALPLDTVVDGSVIDNDESETQYDERIEPGSLVPHKVPSRSEYIMLVAEAVFAHAQYQPESVLQFNL